MESWLLKYCPWWGMSDVTCGEWHLIPNRKLLLPVPNCTGAFSCYFKQSVHLLHTKVLALWGKKGFEPFSNVGWRKTTKENLRLLPNWVLCGVKSSPEICNLGGAPHGGWDGGLSCLTKHFWEKGELQKFATFGWWILRASEYFVFLSALGKNNKITCKCSFFVSAFVNEWAIPAPNFKGDIVITQGALEFRRQPGSVPWHPSGGSENGRKEGIRLVHSRTSSPCFFMNNSRRVL